MRLRALDQRSTKTRLFNFFWRHIVPGDVFDPIAWPEELADPHATILPHDFLATNGGAFLESWPTYFSWLVIRNPALPMLAFAHGHAP